MFYFCVMFESVFYFLVMFESVLSYSFMTEPFLKWGFLMILKSYQGVDSFYPGSKNQN